MSPTTNTAGGRSALDSNGGGGMYPDGERVGAFDCGPDLGGTDAGRAPGPPLRGGGVDGLADGLGGGLIAPRLEGGGVDGIRGGGWGAGGCGGAKDRAEGGGGPSTAFAATGSFADETSFKDTGSLGDAGCLDSLTDTGSFVAETAFAETTFTGTSLADAGSLDDAGCFGSLRVRAASFATFGSFTLSFADSFEASFNDAPSFEDGFAESAEAGAFADGFAVAEGALGLAPPDFDEAARVEAAGAAAFALPVPLTAGFSGVFVGGLEGRLALDFTVDFAAYLEAEWGVEGFDGALRSGRGIEDFRGKCGDAPANPRLRPGRAA